MKTAYLALAALMASSTFARADAPLVEKYLHRGEYAQGEQALEAALAANPKDDQIRFGLGFLRVLRGVERLGQALHEYGAITEHSSMPFLRLPVPKNPDPAPISYVVLHRVLGDFHRDLASAESALAGITDDRVTLPLRLAGIHMDLNADGRADDSFLIVLKSLLQRQRGFEFLLKNPTFLVKFDRGDAAWLQSYCHLLMGMLDFYLAFETEAIFDETAKHYFAKPKLGKKYPGLKENDWWKEIIVKEPARLGNCRKHLLAVTELNRVTWKHIRAEVDDDYEWLPNPKQTGVLSLPVRDEQIAAWAAMMAELELLFSGQRTFTKDFGLDKNGKGLNLKRLFDDPPAKFVLQGFPHNLDDKYFTDEAAINVNVLFAAFTLFSDSLGASYAMWFN